MAYQTMLVNARVSFVSNGSAGQQHVQVATTDCVSPSNDLPPETNPGSGPGYMSVPRAGLMCPAARTFD